MEDVVWLGFGFCYLVIRLLAKYGYQGNAASVGISCDRIKVLYIGFSLVGRSHLA